MKLWVALSYFFGEPRSEVWQLELQTGQKELSFDIPQLKSRQVAGKGVTGLRLSSAQHFLCCDFNTVYLIDKKGVVQAQYFDEQNNDLHNLYVDLKPNDQSDNGSIYVVNTGLDCIDVLSFNLKRLARYEGVSFEQLKLRCESPKYCDGDYYQDGEHQAFFQTKVQDKWHFNHVIKLPLELGGQLLATSLSRRAMVDLTTMKLASNVLPCSPHDGVVWRNGLWVTTVEGKIYRADLSAYTASCLLQFELVFDLFCHGQYHGWCRGLAFSGNKVWVGLTAIYRQNSRTKWLDVPLEQTRTGIYQLCAIHWQIEQFYDFSDTDGARIFSFVVAGDND